MQIIGISGSNGSGKDTIANWLGKEHGFYVASATDMLAEELIGRGLPLERENKRQISSEWRKQYGLAAIVDKAVVAAKTAGYEKLVVGSLRHSAEVDRVHELNGVVLWFDADPRVRYNRIQAGNRGRVEDQKTFEQFLAEEQAEMQQSGDVTSLNMATVKAKADSIIINDVQTIDAFIDAAKKALVEYL